MGLDYISRFWTLFVSWLAMQRVSRAGLQPGVALGQRRFTIVPIHNAPNALEQVLIELWADKDPRQVYDILSSPDITVTNQRDKNVQLPKVLKLNADVLSY